MPVAPSGGTFLREAFDGIVSCAFSSERKPPTKADYKRYSSMLTSMRSKDIDLHLRWNKSLAELKLTSLLTEEYEQRYYARYITLQEHVDLSHHAYADQFDPKHQIL